MKLARLKKRATIRVEEEKSKRRSRHGENDINQEKTEMGNY